MIAKSSQIKFLFSIFNGYLTLLVTECHHETILSDGGSGNWKLIIVECSNYFFGVSIEDGDGSTMS